MKVSRRDVLIFGLMGELILGCASLGTGMMARQRAAIEQSPLTQLLWVRYDGTRFDLWRQQIIPGSVREEVGVPERSAFRFVLESAQGDVLYAGGFDDPRRLHVDRLNEEGQLEGETIQLPERIFLLRVPYREEAVRLRISDDSHASASFLLDSSAVVAETFRLPPYTTQTVIRTGPSSNRLDIVFLGDGYRVTEMEKFDRDVRTFAEYLLSTPPYANYRQAVNIHKVNVISRDSGIDWPRWGLWRDTALDMTFDFEGVPEAIYAPVESEYKIYQAAALVPEADLVVVLVNERDFGGSSGPLKNISVVTTHPLGPELLLHELGHSFAFLADESDGPAPPPLREPSKVNVTLERTREGLRRVGKWDYWMDEEQPIPPSRGSSGVGIYEGGLGSSRGVYRPALTCRMRTLGHPFCPICMEQHIRRLYFYIRPIEAISPPSSSFALSPDETEITFRVVPLQGLTDVEITWSVDGLPHEPREDRTSVTLSAAALSPGEHRITVTITDRTPLVRRDPARLLSAQATWILKR